MEGSAERMIAKRIEEKLAAQLELAHLEVHNESHRHQVAPGAESHFKLVLVSDSFTAQPRIARHRTINRLLAEELAGPVHALAIHAYSPAEWLDRHGDAPLSPPCVNKRVGKPAGMSAGDSPGANAGGSKAERVNRTSP